MRILDPRFKFFNVPDWLSSWYWEGEYRSARSRMQTLEFLERDTRAEFVRQLRDIEQERLGLNLRLGKIETRLVQHAQVTT